MDVVENISLRALNTLALPARAEYFCRVDSLAELELALAHARRHRLAVTILGGGSNIVCAGDVAGLVIQIDIRGIAVTARSGDDIDITVGAGENWHALVTHCLHQGWHGLENLALIPGRVGAAPVQNIGAYGVELADVFVALDALTIPSGEHRRLSRNDCRFGYRDSLFKGARQDRYAITAVTLRLSRLPRVVLDYPSLQQAFAGMDSVTPQQVYTAVCDLRRLRLPDPAELPNAGSFFKNPIVSAATAKVLAARFPGLVTFPHTDGQVKLAAGWLIDQAGWKGIINSSGAGVHGEQALVLVNCGQCDGHALLALAADIQADIRQRFGVELELEPRVLGG
ncbi:MAG: UDP-N-acetylmuramate dehydrogenase [Porticoccaceae bacterium]